MDKGWVSMANYLCKICKCDSFRVNAFRPGIKDEIFANLICKNCGHTLAEHRDLPSAEQWLDTYT